MYFGAFNGINNSYIIGNLLHKLNKVTHGAKTSQTIIKVIICVSALCT